MPAVERIPAACSECRKHKIKCHPAPDDPEHTLPCERCVKFDLDCQFLKHRRGRKPKNQNGDTTSQIAEEDPGQGDSYSSYLQGSPMYRREGSSRSAVDEEAQRPDGQSRLPRFAFMGYSAEAGPGPDTSLRRVVDTPRVSPGADTNDRRMPESDVRRVVTTLRSPLMGKRTQEEAADPVQAGLISDVDARPLYDLYLRYFNTAMPLLDAEVDTPHAVRSRSSFLYTAILCVASRYISTSYCRSRLHTDNAPTPDSPQSVHQHILVMARDHMTRAFADATRTEDVLKAVLILSFWKEPDEAQAGYHFGRAVLLAQELGLGRVYSQAQQERMTVRDMARVRARQRLWYNIFVINTIFHMQFDQRLLIDEMDPLINTATNWLRGSNASTLLADSRLVYSVEIRRKYIAYRRSVQDPLTQSKPSLLALAFTARRFNADWDSTADAWEKDLSQAGSSSAQMTKSRLYASSLKLSLNLVLVHQMRLAQNRDRQADDSSLASNAYHNAVNAATQTLGYIEAIEPPQVTFAADTLLHFSLYAASFLWAMCNEDNDAISSTVEKSAVYDLIKRTATILGDASAYPSDSPALHARYLRRLVRKYEQQQLRPSVITNTFMPVQNGNMDGLPTSALAALASAAQHPMHMPEASNIQPLLQPQLQTTISPTTLSIPGLEAMPTDWSFPEMPNDFDLDSFLNFPWHGDGTGGDVGADGQWMF